jgi:hypothetical protein
MTAHLCLLETPTTNNRLGEDEEQIMAKTTISESFTGVTVEGGNQ